MKIPVDQVRPVINTGLGLTKQSHRDECDVNLIVRNFQRTGILAFQNRQSPMYGEVPAIDFQAAMEQVTTANKMFMDMPPSLRKRFQNDPGLFLEFIQDENNEEEARRIGLLPPSRPEAITAGTVTEPSPQVIPE